MGKRSDDLTIIVNTSDNFEDCWPPFFTLFRQFWPDCPYPVILNTETKDFRFDGLSIRASKVSVGETRRLKWGDCLIRCLDGISSPYVLYLQEDYFLEGPVRGDLIGAFLDELGAGRADVIRLIEFEGAGPWHPSAHKLLWEVDQNARYRISLQAALWRKNSLRSLIRRHESAWDMENYGSARARSRKEEKVLCVNRDIFMQPGKEVFPYQPTGVISGKWERRIVEPLFARHGIIIDFSKRGFYNPATGKQRKWPEVMYRLYGRILWVLRYIRNL